MQPNSISIKTVLAETQNFPDEFQSLILSTLSSEHIPNASYAPFVKIAGDFYVYISELSQHTRNLQEQTDVSVLFLEDEASSQHIFARKRLTLACQAQEVPRDDEAFNTIMKSFEGKFGGFIAQLKVLQDFHLFKISATNGSYIRGFAQAYTLDGDDLSNISHIRDKGHTRQSHSAGHNSNAA